MKLSHYLVTIFLFLIPITCPAEEIIKKIPKLTINNHKICTEIFNNIDDSHRKKSTYNNYSVFSPFTKDIGDALTFIPNMAQIDVSGNTFYLYKDLYCPTCHHALYLSSFQLPKNKNEFKKILAQNSELSRVANGELFQSKTGEYYVLGGHPYSLKAYKITKQGNYIESCHITLEPPSIKKELPNSLKKALSNMKTSRNMVAGDAGNCGSMNTHSHWESTFNYSLYSLPQSPSPADINDAAHRVGIESYENDLLGLSDWSLTGMSAYKQFKKYQENFEILLNELTLYYIVKLKWDEERAKNIATQSLKAVLGDSIRFYNYKPFLFENERTLRASILAGKSIESIEFNYSQYNKLISNYVNDLGLKENLLPIAIHNPSAMAYLIKNKVDVNANNQFGKTALMYAVQHNNFEVVKLLIESDAHINAETIIPFDRCNYKITTSNYTPLHYATRYASFNIIKYLIDTGAAKYAITNNIQKVGNNRYPKDWLDANKNLSAEEVQQLKYLLKVPTGIKATALAQEFTSIGQKKYEQGQLKEAYQLLLNATSLAPKNVNALLMMSEIANKLNQPRKAAETAVKAYKLNISLQQKAHAIMNIVNAIKVYVSKSSYDKRNSFSLGRQGFSTRHIFQLLLKVEELNSTLSSRQEIKSLLNLRNNLTCSNSSRLSLFIDQNSPTFLGKLPSSINITSNRKVKEVCLTNKYSNQLVKKCFSEPNIITLGGQESLSNFNIQDMVIDIERLTISMKVDGVECL